MKENQQRQATTPSPWRRVITGAVGFPLLGLGTFLGLSWANCLDHPQRGGWECQGWGFAFAFIGAPGLLIGIPLALAALVPFGTLRRILVGIAAAIPAAGAVAMAVAAAAGAARATGDDIPLFLSIWALGTAFASGAAFYLAYRIAR